MYIKSTKRSQRARETRKRIHECALRLFSDLGFDNVTVEEVAATAGVSVGAFYHHFKSKQSIMAVYHETLDERYEAYYETVMRTSAFSQLTAPEKLEALNLYVIEMCVKEGVEYVRVVYPYMLTNDAFGNSIIDTDRPHCRIVLEIVAAGQESGQIARELEPMDILRDIMILCRGSIVDWCLHNGSTPIREHAHSALRYYLKGIAA